MLIHTRSLRPSAPIGIALAVIVGVSTIWIVQLRTPQNEGQTESHSESQIESQFERQPDRQSQSTAVNSSVCSRADFIVRRGVESLKDRVPGRFIRGMLDTENSDLSMSDFEKAALVLAPKKNPDAEFILGWLCADGAWHAPGREAMGDLFSKRIDYSKLGLSLNERLAAQWYQLASMHGSKEASVAMGQMLEFTYGGDREKRLALAAHYYMIGVTQGDIESRIFLACSYAYGRGVKADTARAWRELEDVIEHCDLDNSTFAIIKVIEAWKDGKLTPPESFARGAADAYEFAQRYYANMTKQELDNLYFYSGSVPDAGPQFRWDLATKIRKDWVKSK